MKTRARIFLVDDHPMMRERMTELIQSQTDLMVYGEADKFVKSQALTPYIFRNIDWGLNGAEGSPPRP
jgi:DNA-binding NarL/FixJ family response regulator